MIKTLSEIGTTTISDPRLKRYITIVNKVSILIAVFDVMGGSFFWANGLFYPATIFFAAALCFGVGLPLLNYAHCYYASRFSFSFFGVGSIFLLALYFGEDSYAHVVLFMAASHVFYMMSPREYSLWIPAVLMPVLAFVGLWWFDFDFGYRMDPLLMAEHRHGIHAIMWSFTFIFITIMGYLFTTQEQRYETKLQKLIKNLGEEIKSRQQTEKKLAKAKDQNDILVAILCHDTVNSLIALRHAAEDLSNMLASQPRRDTAMDLMVDINANLQSITDLVIHVRKMAMMVNGVVELPLAPVCLDETIAKASKLFESMLRSKNMRLNCRSSLALSETYIWGDESTIVHEVLANVLSNAIKFSNENSSVDVDISGDAEKVVVAVRDYGIGIPAKSQASLFDLKLKVSRPGTKGEPGVGLGLSLLQSYVELLRGRVRCESRTAEEGGEGQGTTIYLEFSRCPCPRQSGDGSATSAWQACTQVIC